MKIHIAKACHDFDSYRAARVKSMFNVESGANFNLDAQLDIDDDNWSIGVVVGASGTGKTSIGEVIFGNEAFYNPHWTGDKPIIDEIAPHGQFNHVTGALSAVGLGNVPSWLRPYPVLSNGEQFRANLARLVIDAPKRVVIDEFTSVIDRRIAQIGSAAFAKAWRKTTGQVVLLTPHYDVLDWLQPDWVFDTTRGHFDRRSVRHRPQIELQIWRTNWRYWGFFEKHHYLKLPHMVAATNYIAVAGDEKVAHLAVSTRPGLAEARACRLVVSPEWQGVGVGMRFLNWVCQEWLEGRNRYDKCMTTLFHTSHPALAAVLRKSPLWTQVSGSLHGGNGKKAMIALAKLRGYGKSKYGGHFRAVQGFRYIGDRT